MLTRVGVAVAALACAPIATAGPGCAPIGGALALPEVVAETSGIAISLSDPSRLWTHNDGDSQLFALDRAGAVLASFPVRGRTSDLEDIASGACWNGGSCLYLADTGDNQERRGRGSARILRVTEPDPSSPGMVDVDVFPVRLPDGPRDIEAIFVLPGERVHLVSKGRSHPVTVYRYPGVLRPDTVTLEAVQTLTDDRQPLLDQVTGASASASGATVAIRTYQALRFYGVRGDSLVAVAGGMVNLRPVEEVQGEGVAIGAQGEVLLTSEGGPFGGAPGMRLLRCAAEPGLRIDG